MSEMRQEIGKTENRKTNGYIAIIGIYSLFVVFSLVIFGTFFAEYAVVFEQQAYLFLTIGSLLIISVFFVRPVRVRMVVLINVRQAIKPKNILISSILFLLLAFAFETLILIDPFANLMTKSAIKYNFTTYYPLIWILASTTIGPIWEEVFFRGMLIRGLSEKFPTWVGVLLSGVGFVLLHPIFPLLAIVYTIFYTFIFLYTRSLLLVIAIHICWNVFQVIYNFI